MPIRFESNPLLDIYIFSGVNVKYTPSEDSTEQIGIIAERAFDNIEQLFNEHKRTLSLTYDQFLKKIEENISEINNRETSQEIKNTVAAKLSDLAKTRIKTQESKFLWIHKFFHKIGQFCQGHGYQTKGEWGIELSFKMRGFDLKEFNNNLKKWISGLLSDKFLNDMKNEINNFTSKQFEDVLEDVIFKTQEFKDFDGKNKFIFFKNLDGEKQEIFYKKLFSRDDWYTQAFHIIENCNDEEFKEFVSKGTVIRGLASKFQGNSTRIFQTYENQINKNENFKKFYNTIVEAHIKDCLDRGSFRIIGILATCDNINFKQILELPQILTAEEIEILGTKVIINHYQ